MNHLFQWILYLTVLVVLGIVIAILLKQRKCCKSESFQDSPTTGTRLVIFQKVSNNLGFTIVTDLMRFSNKYGKGSGYFKGVPVRIMIKNNTLMIDNYNYPLSNEGDLSKFTINGEDYYLASWDWVSTRLFPYGKVQCIDWN